VLPVDVGCVAGEVGSTVREMFSAPVPSSNAIARTIAHRGEPDLDQISRHGYLSRSHLEANLAIVLKIARFRPARKDLQAS